MHGVGRRRRIISYRTPIAVVLVAHGVMVLTRDDLDVWAYGEAEGLGAYVGVIH